MSSATASAPGDVLTQAQALVSQLQQVLSDNADLHTQLSQAQQQRDQYKAALLRLVQGLSAMGFVPQQTAPAQTAPTPDASAPAPAASPAASTPADAASAPTSGGASFLTDQPGEYDPFAGQSANPYTGSADTVFPPDH